jgi:hypothetical protein
MNANNMSRTSLEKDTNDHFDSYNEKANGDDVDRHLQVQLPESLQGLSAEEIAKIDKEATRKLDILLMPILVVLYILNYLDRQNIASAKIAGIHVDLNLSTTQYNTAVAVLFAGYVALQIPSNMVASKISVPGICKSYLPNHSRIIRHADQEISVECASRGVWSVPALVLYTLLLVSPFVESY